MKLFYTFIFIIASVATRTASWLKEVILNIFRTGSGVLILAIIIRRIIIFLPHIKKARTRQSEKKPWSGETAANFVGFIAIRPIIFSTMTSWIPLFFITALLQILTKTMSIAFHILDCVTTSGNLL